MRPRRSASATPPDTLPRVDVHSAVSDGTLRRLVEEGRLVVNPFDPGRVQPASIDLLLGDSFRVFNNHRVTAIDGSVVSVNAQTVCLHGDGAHALAFARRIRESLEREGIAVMASA